ncbi:MAG: hypothetical protein DHS20C16_08750 [Phycisphaerae bacterium]|nr:MAG: hypothetical protein DHS20C16_08750 [Phycisphaerae bacterium]
MCQSANDNQQPQYDERQPALSRREFIVGSAVAAGGLALGTNPTMAADRTTNRHGLSQVRVIQGRSKHVLTPLAIHEDVLRDLLEMVVTRLSGKERVADAWHEFLKPDDIIALKFNRNGARTIATTAPLLRAFVASLGSAGFKPSQIVAVEVSNELRSSTQTLAPVQGWSKEVYDFGSGKDQLAAWLDQVTAIINVPFLKTHNLAVMTGAMKNISHAVVKHPARYHENGCSPFIGDIVALPQVRNKLRLHIVNALRIVFDEGPVPREETIWDGGFLIGGTDPVAVDVSGLHLIDRVRKAVGLPLIGETSLPAYLEAADGAGVGTGAVHKISLEKVKL